MRRPFAWRLRGAAGRTWRFLKWWWVPVLLLYAGLGAFAYFALGGFLT